MSSYTIDLCVNWQRIGECPHGTFDGTVRNLTIGEWRLEGDVAGLQLEAGYTIEDVDTIRIVRDATIVFTGFVQPVASGAGGLELARQTAERFTLTGPDAWDVLTTRLAYPTPATEQPWADSHDTRTGVASTVAAAYVENNAGYLALATRQIAGLTVVDGSTGISGTWSARLQPLDQLIQRVCRDGGIVCRVSISYAGAVQVILRAVRDRRTTAVFSDQGDLIQILRRIVPPSATYVIAGGQGELTARTFAAAGTATGAARREKFSDQTSLNSAGEVQQAATTTLALGAESFSVRADLTDTAAARLAYLTDYDVGDIVAVEIGTVRYPVVVEAVTVHLSPGRKVITPILGEGAPDLLAGLVRDVAGLQSRFDTHVA